ncbi:MAG: hemin ABC transporter substrate-binding protein [Alphaproteobacteria bacterium]
MIRPATLLLTAALALPAAAEDGPRVVSIGGDLTEIVYALGAGRLLVGADTTSTWPAEAEELAKVGYMRQLAAEGILSLAPDLVIAAGDAGPQTVLDRLEMAGVEVRVAPDDASVEGVVDKIRFVGAALGRTAEADAAIAAFEAEMATVGEALAGLTDRPRVLFLISAGTSSMVAAGAGTSAEAIIALAHGQNALGGFEGFKPVGAEAIIAAAPDVLLLPSHTAAQPGGLDAILAEPALAATPAVANGRVVVMDSLLLLGFGPRTPEAILALADALHPGLAAAAGE